MANERSNVGRLARGLLDAVVPTRCPGCGQWDVRLCASCEGIAWREPARRTLEEELGPPLGVWMLGAYEGPLRRLILAAKHDARLDLAGFLQTGGRTLGRALAPVIDGDGEVWVVPAPSGWRRRWDGRMVVRPLAYGVACGLAEGAHRGARVIEAVALRPRSGSQSGRSGAARRAGRSGAMRARVTPAGVRAVLVDDVMTTGATLREMARVLGPAVRAAAVLAGVGERRVTSR